MIFLETELTLVSLVCFDLGQILNLIKAPKSCIIFLEFFCKRISTNGLAFESQTKIEFLESALNPERWNIFHLSV